MNKTCQNQLDGKEKVFHETVVLEKNIGIHLWTQRIKYRYKSDMNYAIKHYWISVKLNLYIKLLIGIKKFIWYYINVGWHIKRVELCRLTFFMNSHEYFHISNAVWLLIRHKSDMNFIAVELYNLAPFWIGFNQNIL